MATVSKLLKRQDCEWKIGPGPSGETSINLPQDFLQLLAGDLAKGSQRKISFMVYSRDFEEAVERIVAHLPLYKTTSKSSEKIDTGSAAELIQSLKTEIDSFFGKDVEKDEK